MFFWMIDYYLLPNASDNKDILLILDQATKNFHSKKWQELNFAFLCVFVSTKEYPWTVVNNTFAFFLSI